MFDIANNGIITITQGDYVTTPLFINQGDKLHPIRYSLMSNPESELYLGVMDAFQGFEESLIRKKYTYQSPHTEQRDVIIELTSNDTQYLKPGKYYYEVKLNHKNLDGTYTVFTIIPRRMFYIEGVN